MTQSVRFTQPTDRTSLEWQEATPADTLPMPNNRNAAIKKRSFLLETCYKHVIRFLILSFLHVSGGNPVCRGYKSFAATYCPRNTRKDAKKFRYFRVFSWAKSFAGSYPRSPFPRGRVSREQVSGRQQELAPTGNIEIYGWQPSQALFSQQMYR